MNGKRRIAEPLQELHNNCEEYARVHATYKANKTVFNRRNILLSAVIAAAVLGTAAVLLARVGLRCTPQWISARAAQIFVQTDCLNAAKLDTAAVGYTLCDPSGDAVLRGALTIPGQNLGFAGLQPGTTYTLRFSGENGTEIGAGAAYTFTTPGTGAAKQSALPANKLNGGRLPLPVVPLPEITPQQPPTPEKPVPKPTPKPVPTPTPTPTPAADLVIQSLLQSEADMGQIGVEAVLVPNKATNVRCTATFGANTVSYSEAEMAGFFDGTVYRVRFSFPRATGVQQSVNVTADYQLDGSAKSQTASYAVAGGGAVLQNASALLLGDASVTVQANGVVYSGGEYGTTNVYEMHLSCTRDDGTTVSLPEVTAADYTVSGSTLTFNKSIPTAGLLESGRTYTFNITALYTVTSGSANDFGTTAVTASVTMP